MENIPDNKWISDSITKLDGFPRPNWQTINQTIEENYPESEQQAIWITVIKTWLELLADELGPNYQYHESSNFFILTSENPEYVNQLTDFLEKALKRITFDYKDLPGDKPEEASKDDLFATFITYVEKKVKQIISPRERVYIDDARGKYVVVIIDQPDVYNPYIAYYYPEHGKNNMKAGRYIHQGYGHLVLPHEEIKKLQPVAVHELTHGCLREYELPVWLDEGLALRMENILSYGLEFRMTSDMHFRHRSFWNKNNIQEFWEGSSFDRSDEGLELSYHLAEFLIQLLSRDPIKFRNFVRKAHYSDAGETATRALYNRSLGQLVDPILGDGYWQPNPTNWKKERSHE